MVELGYNSWPFSRQLKLSQVFFSMLVSLGLILTTRYQMIWLSDKIKSEYTNLLQSDILSQMRELAYSEKSYIQQEFLNNILFVENLQKLDSLILGFTTSSSIIQASEPVQHTVYTSKDYVLSNGAFMSSHNPLSHSGASLEKIQAGMDKIYPLIKQPHHQFIYSGFETDEIIHFYPGSYLGSLTYTPLVREWYYKAKDQLGHVVITEPYIDAISGAAVVTISTSIVNKQNQFFGVAACDITLALIQERVYATSILKNGFLILVSVGGVMLTAPKQWNLTQTSKLIIYDEDLTGINEALWDQIVQSEDGVKFRFTRGDNEYFLVKYEVQPYPDSLKITHFVLACAGIEETVEPVDCIQKSFQETYYLIFVLVVAIAVFTFFSISAGLHLLALRLARKLKTVKNIFSKISHRALIPDVTRGITFDEVNRCRAGIESLADATKIKICQVREKEESFKYFPWKFTRPSEDFFYYKWSSKLYPYNYFNGKVLSWRKSLTEIQNENLN